MPGLQGCPAQARVAGRADRRQVDRRGVPAAIADAARFFDDVDFTVRERQIAERVIKEINARLGFLLDVGLDYLSLDRPAGTLPAARPSASGSPPRSGPAWSACSTCSTSRASGCTSATTTG